MNWKEELKWQKGQLLGIIIPSRDDIFLLTFAAAFTVVGIGSIMAAYATVELITIIVG